VNPESQQTLKRYDISRNLIRGWVEEYQAGALDEDAGVNSRSFDPSPHPNENTHRLATVMSRSALASISWSWRSIRLPKVRTCRNARGLDEPLRSMLRSTSSAHSSPSFSPSERIGHIAGLRRTWTRQSPDAN